MALVVLAAGASLPLAFAPFGWMLLAPVTLAVLFASWWQVAPRRAALHGLLFGCGQFFVGCLWIHESFQFSNVPLGPALTLTGLFAFGMALYPALLGYLVRRFGALLPAPLFLGLLCPGGWVLFEWLRGRLFTGFSWLQVGYSQVDGPLVALLPLGGVLLASLMLALLGGALAALVTGRCREHRAGLVPVTAVTLLLLGAGIAHPPPAELYTRNGLEPLEVALVQGNYAQDEKWKPENRLPTLARYRELSAPALGADLIVWPETALPGLLHEFQDYLGTVAREAHDAGSTLVTGVPVLGVRADGSRYLRNAVIDVRHPSDRYDKRHLVPFGEYLPFRELLAGPAQALGLPTPNFSKGPDRQPVISAASWRLGISICYEAAFGREVRRALPDAGLLLTLSNDAWFGSSIGPHQHFQMARARAAETGRTLLRVTNTGITAIVDANGAVVESLRQFEAGVLRGQAWPRNGATPYVTFGDTAVLLLAGLALVVAVGAGRALRR